MHSRTRALARVWLGLPLLLVCADCKQRPATTQKNDAGLPTTADVASEIPLNPDAASGGWFSDIRITLPTCGNGRLDPGEACDDGNAIPGDGCSADCTAVELGWECTLPPRWPCSPICGDGVRAGDESCDDGNIFDGDGCSARCLTEPGWDCTNGSCLPVSAGDAGVEGSYCGDGEVNGTEECDLGEQNGKFLGKGGCSIGCTKLRFCGDGIVDVDQGEQCDEGELNGLWLDKNMNPADSVHGVLYCTSECLIPECCVSF